MDKKILLAGAWVGEFGWELCSWQGHLRRLSKKFDEVHIVSRKGHEFLYQDFATKFHIHDSPASKADSWMGEVDVVRMTEIFDEVNPTHHIKPFNLGYLGGRIINTKFKEQDFIKYESDIFDESYDIIVHARNKIIGSERNWDVRNWAALIDEIPDKYSICTIGSEEAFGFDGIDDYRGVSIEETVALINRCKLVIGQSSGAMHLASLSGARHFVWSDSTNKSRYNSDWNPHKTPIHFYDDEGWNPKVENIYKEIKKIL
jgi:hypothetical protein